MHLKQAVDRFYINCLFLTLGKNLPVGSIGKVRSNYSQKFLVLRMGGETFGERFVIPDREVSGKSRLLYK